MGRRRWTAQEELVRSLLYTQIPVEELAERLGRTKRAVQRRAAQMKEREGRVQSRTVYQKQESAKWTKYRSEKEAAEATRLSQSVEELSEYIVIHEDAFDEVKKTWKDPK